MKRGAPKPAQVVRGELRLTGGERRGAKLYTVDTPDLRPALARMRKSLFDSLGPWIAGKTVVDLFAGTGSLAFESLSRGASRAALFEMSPLSAEAIRRNVQRLKWSERVVLFEESAYGAADRLKDSGWTADLVFVDPPYAHYGIPEERDRLFQTLVELPMQEGGRILVEHPGRVEVPEHIGRAVRSRQRNYGGTTLSFYEVGKLGSWEVGKW